MRTVEATERLAIEVPGPGEVDRPLIHVKEADVEDRAVTVYGQEIRHPVAALSEAAGVLVGVWERRAGRSTTWTTLCSAWTTWPR
jgi:hypothetical protein